MGNIPLVYSGERVLSPRPPPCQAVCRVRRMPGAIPWQPYKIPVLFPAFSKVRHAQRRYGGRSPLLGLLSVSAKGW